jgi:hypothetical protein
MAVFMLMVRLSGLQEKKKKKKSDVGLGNLQATFRRTFGLNESVQP